MEWAAAALSGAGKVADYFSGRDKQKSDEAIARANIEAQREFAQQGIRWKVNDALAAGVHPLAALGASTTSFSPVQVGGGQQTDFSGMGQDFGRAIESMMQKDEKAQRRADEASKLAIEKAGLENDILRAELNSKIATRGAGSAQQGPGMPSPVSRVPLPRPGPDRTVGGVAVSEDDIKQKAEDYPQTKVVRPFGYPLYANPWFNDGQQFEDRYGDSEIGSTGKFIVNTIADHAYTGWRWANEGYRGNRTGDAARRRRRSRPWGE